MYVPLRRARCALPPFLRRQAAPETIKLLDDLLLSWPNVSKPSRSSLEASPENLGFYALFAGTDSSVRSLLYNNPILA